MRDQGGGEEDRYDRGQPRSEPPSRPYPPAEPEGQFGWSTDRGSNQGNNEHETPWRGDASYGSAPPHGYPSPAYGPPPGHPGAGYAPPHGEYAAGYGPPPPPAGGYPPPPQGQPGAGYPPPQPMPDAAYGQPPGQPYAGSGPFPPPPQPGAAYGVPGWSDQQRGYRAPAGGYGSYGRYADGGYGYGPPHWYGPAPAVPTEQSAVWALILAIASYPLLFACGAGLITLVVSFVLAPQAQHKIETSGGAWQGVGLTRAAMVLNWILLGLVVLGLVLFTITLVVTG